MSVRVRKLARELDRSPEDLLLLLHDLGFERFKSADDMMPEPVAEQLRKAARKVPPRSLATDAPAGPRRRAPPPGERFSTPRPAPDLGVDDFMSSVVPGIVRTTAPGAYETSPGKAALELKRLEAERAAILKEREDLGRDREQMRAERDELVEAMRRVGEAREALAIEQAELLAAKEALGTALDNAQRGSLLGLLEERGLRGIDEAERALGALAGAHAFGRLLSSLVPLDPQQVRRTLADRLVLVSGIVPEGLGVPAVVVSDDRADLPSPDRLQKALARLGERLLLHGRRRVVLVGVPPRWHGVLRAGIDRRVEVVFRAGPADGASDPTEVSWEPPRIADNPARADGRAPTLIEFIDRWLGSLAD